MGPMMKKSSHTNLHISLAIAAFVVAVIMSTLSPGIPPETANLVGP